MRGQQQSLVDPDDVMLSLDALRSEIVGAAENHRGIGEEVFPDDKQEVQGWVVRDQNQILRSALVLGPDVFGDHPGVVLVGVPAHVQVLDGQADGLNGLQSLADALDDTVVPAVALVVGGEQEDFPGSLTGRCGIVWSKQHGEEEKE